MKKILSVKTSLDFSRKTCSDAIYARERALLPWRRSQFTKSTQLQFIITILTILIYISAHATAARSQVLISSLREELRVIYGRFCVTFVIKAQSIHVMKLLLAFMRKSFPNFKDLVFDTNGSQHNLRQLRRKKVRPGSNSNISRVGGAAANAYSSNSPIF